MLRFNYTYALLSLFLFTLEVIIERFFHGGFIRNVFGDYLVVFLIYCFVLSFFKWKKLYVAIGVLVLAYLIEIAQYIDVLQLLKIKKSHRPKYKEYQVTGDWYCLGFESWRKNA